VKTPPGSSTSRPTCLVLVAGTGTGVGKTWVAAALARRLRAEGTAVCARKPAQSFEPGEPATDAEVLAGASGEHPEAVCAAHRWYPVPMAPPMAADALGRGRFVVADLVAELAWAPGTAVGLVEAAGGVRSPLADDGDTVDLAAALRPDRAVLVADAGLGAVHAVLTSVALLAPWPTTVFLNRHDPLDGLHRRNRDWLADRHGLDAVTDLSTLEHRCRP
jgi:dethiobiotin synthetase